MRRSEALEAAKEIWDDLSDRSGFGLECLESDDPDTHEEILTRMAVIILKKASVEAERKDSDPGIDPWELLREAMLAWNKQVNMSTFHDDVLGDWKACIAEWRRINAALKQHDAERKSDGT